MEPGDRDLALLEQSYNLLAAFLDRCAIPLGRALAAASFIERVPESHRGKAYYLSDVTGVFLDSLGQLKGAIVDPKHLEAIAAALNRLSSAGLVAEGAVRDLLRALSADAGEEPPGRAQIGVPAVLVLPLILDAAEAPSVGLLLRLSSSPRLIGRQDARIRWHDARAAVPAGALRSFEDVGADALLAATETVRTLAGRPGAVAPDFGRRASRLRGRLGRLGFDLSLAQKEVHAAGDSIGLALAIEFAGTMIGVLSRGHGLRSRSTVAWTGAVLPSGEVKPVGVAGLAAKARAAYLGGHTTLVVPRGMGDDAREAVRSEGLDLRVRELGDVAEALLDPELVEPARVPADIVEGCTRERATRLAVLGAVAIVVALLVWLLPPRPGEPRILAPEGSTVMVADEGVRPAFTARTDGPIFMAHLTTRLHGDFLRLPWLVVLSGMSDATVKPGALSIYDLFSGLRIDRYRFTRSGLPYEPKLRHPTATYSAKYGVVGDLDGDGRDEVVVTAACQPESDAFLWRFDTGRPSGAVYHSGHLELMVAGDLDRDGNDEVVAAGFHGPSGGMSILAMEGSQFYPFADDARSQASGPASPTWDAERQPCIRHLVIPMPPGLEAVQGRRSLGFPNRAKGIGWTPPTAATTLSLVSDADSTTWIRCAVNAAEDPTEPAWTADYLILLRPTDGAVEIEVNAVMRDRAANWIRTGLTTTDFASDSRIAAWKAQFSCTDYVLNEWPPPADRP
jgi:hypothetical protein